MGEQKDNWECVYTTCLHLYRVFFVRCNPALYLKGIELEMQGGRGMTEELPENIVSIEALRINRNIDKRCNCTKRSFVVDSRNKAVHCSGCGAWVDPYDAMYELARHYERLENETRELLEQRRKIARYKPHMVVFRKLEKQYRGRKMLLACPHCSRGFFFEELSLWTNAEMEKKRREREVSDE